MNSSTIAAIFSSAQFTINGRLGKDPEARYLNSGSVVAKGRLAISQGKDSDPVWFEVEAWGSLAEEFTNNFSKGQMVTVTGRIYENSWTTKTGEERLSPVIKATRIEGEQAAPSPVRAKDEFPF